MPDDGELEDRLARGAIDDGNLIVYQKDNFEAWVRSDTWVEL